MSAELKMFMIFTSALVVLGAVAICMTISG